METHAKRYFANTVNNCVSQEFMLPGFRDSRGTIEKCCREHRESQCFFEKSIDPSREAFGEVAE